MSMGELSKSYGVKFDYEIKTDTRPFDQVDAAAYKAGIKHEHLPAKPTMGQAIARAIACLMRVCMSSIEFPAWSQHAQWLEDQPIIRVVNGKRVQVGTAHVPKTGRNPHYSLKITELKNAAKTDASTTWRINIANRLKAGENMGHVLSVVYDPIAGIVFKRGVDAHAFDTFGKEIMEIVNTEYARFMSQYNDEDIRKVMDAELADMRALKVIKNTNRFIAHEYTDRAKALYQFAVDCGQEVSWLTLQADEMTRDSLLKDLQAAVFGAMDEYEAELDEKLNPKGLERKRGEKRREQMYNTARQTIDRIMAMADYHASVLGCMAKGIKERQAALEDKALRLLTCTGDEPTPALPKAAEAVQADAGEQVVDNVDDAFSA